MLTTTTAPCISVIYDTCITEIQEAVVVVIIWWCDLQLHMSYITEIQGPVVVVSIWWCDLHPHMSCITEMNHDHDGLLYFSNT
jgi:hypothetical protein